MTNEGPTILYICVRYVTSHLVRGIHLIHLRGLCWLWDNEALIFCFAHSEDKT
jgi:hypothetical protein